MPNELLLITGQCKLTIIFSTNIWGVVVREITGLDERRTARAGMVGGACSTGDTCCESPSDWAEYR